MQESYQSDDHVYDLSSIGLEGAELVVEENAIYLMTSSAYFPFPPKMVPGDLRDDGTFRVRNEDGDFLVLTSEQHQLILEILDSSVTNKHEQIDR